jgi:hypothetical protein
MQYHYVVVYDSRTESWEVDSDTAYAVFNNGYFFDEETQEWEVLDEDLQAHQEIYSDMSDKLFNILKPHSMEEERV